MERTRRIRHRAEALAAGMIACIGLCLAPGDAAAQSAAKGYTAHNIWYEKPDKVDAIIRGVSW